MLGEVNPAPWAPWAPAAPAAFWAGWTAPAPLGVGLLVGTPRLPPTGVGDAVADGEADGDGLADGEADGDGLADGDDDGDGLADVEGAVNFTELVRSWPFKVPSES